MTTTLTIRSTTPATLDARVTGLRFVAVRDGLWRVHSRADDLLGHVELTGAGRYAARRFLGGNRLRPLGEFWSAQAAAECFG
ncbi:MAG: hypothetical protein ABWY36_08355 [Leifsonia sp.]